jgi:hypothetical protein
METFMSIKKYTNQWANKFCFILVIIFKNIKGEALLYKA